MRSGGVIFGVFSPARLDHYIVDILVVSFEVWCEGFVEIVQAPKRLMVMRNLYLRLGFLLAMGRSGKASRVLNSI